MRLVKHPWNVFVENLDRQLMMKQQDYVLIEHLNSIYPNDELQSMVNSLEKHVD